MHKLSARQCTLRGPLEFEGIGVHSGVPTRMMLEPAPENSGFRLRRVLEDGTLSHAVPMLREHVARTTLCTTLDIGDSLSVATVEHVVAGLSGLGLDNVLITVDGPEVPIMDGSAGAFTDAILRAGLAGQAAKRRYFKVVRTVAVRNNDAFAVIEPYNGRALDVEIDFNSPVIGRQRMIFDWSPRKFATQIAQARTFGFVRDALVLQQAGFALGSSLENSIVIDDDKIQNSDSLRYEDEFVRHKMLDAIGDLALGGLPIYGKFRSYKGGHALNALVLQSLLASDANYEITEVEDLPLAFDALDDLPDELSVEPYLRSVG